jgi:hypothetical protein
LLTTIVSSLKHVLLGLDEFELNRQQRPV